MFSYVMFVLFILPFWTGFAHTPVSFTIGFYLTCCFKKGTLQKGVTVKYREETLFTPCISNITGYLGI